MTIPSQSQQDAAWLAEQATLTVEDLQTCPACGNADGYWLQEMGSRSTWQAFSLRFDPERGGVLPDDYEEWKDGDESEIDHFECRRCLYEWPEFEDVIRALLATKRALADHDALPINRMSTKAAALAVFVTNPLLRGHLEQHDPKALEQARAALGLTPIEGGTNV